MTEACLWLQKAWGQGETLEFIISLLALAEKTVQVNQKKKKS